MSHSTFLVYFAEKIGKDIQSFTAEDWRQAAITAGNWLDRLIDDPSSGSPKKAPRNRKKNAFMSFQPTKRGRPKARYFNGAVTIDFIQDLLEASSEHPLAPKFEYQRLRVVRRVLQKTIGGDEDVATLGRALRRFRSETKKNSGHN